MSIILFSVYYPHAKRTLLIDRALRPLLLQIQHTDIDFFLSTYKGENITVKLKSNHRSSTKKIEKQFSDFFEVFFVEASKASLPINRLFVDFEPNTLHIWDFNPFKVGKRELDRIIVEPHHSLLSKKCLSILGKENSWNETSSFQIFTDLLLVVLSYLSNTKSNVEVFLGIVQSDLEEKLKEQKEIYEKYLLKGRGIFDQNRDSIVEYYRRIDQIINDEKPMDSEILEWKAIIEACIEYNGLQGQNSVEQVLVALVMDASQKFDLNPCGLIMAIGLMSHLKEK